MKIKADLKALRQQAGYTLIELSISVAIIAVLVVTGLYGVPRILDTNRTTNTVQQIMLATANYSKLASTSTDTSWATSGTIVYAPATSLPLAGMGVWGEENVLKSGATSYGLRHEFGGNIYSRNALTGITNFIAPNEGYILKLEKIPARNCFALASSFAKTAIQIDIDTNGTVANGPITAEPTGVNIAMAAGNAFSPTAVAALCQNQSTVAKTIYLWFQY